jgi:hypothetical protein
MKTVTCIARVFACVFALVAYSQSAAAQAQTDGARLDDLARQAARDFAAATSPALDQNRPTEPTPPAGTRSS